MFKITLNKINTYNKLILRHTKIYSLKVDSYLLMIGRQAGIQTRFYNCSWQIDTNTVALSSR